MKTKTRTNSQSILKTPFDRALKYLSLRARSIKEIFEYLKRKGYEKTDINEAIEKLLELKFLNDDDYARMYTESKQKKGKSKKQISFELKLKGINKEISDDILEYSSSDYKTAFAYISKRLKQFDRYTPEEKQKKIISRLRSRGYDWEVISKVLKKIDLAS